MQFIRKFTINGEFVSETDTEKQQYMEKFSLSSSFTFEFYAQFTDDEIERFCAVLDRFGMIQGHENCTLIIKFQSLGESTHFRVQQLCQLVLMLKDVFHRVEYFDISENVVLQVNNNEDQILLQLADALVSTQARAIKFSNMHLSERLLERFISSMNGYAGKLTLYNVTTGQWARPQADLADLKMVQCIERGANLRDLHVHECLVVENSKICSMHQFSICQTLSKLTLQNCKLTDEMLYQLCRQIDQSGASICTLILYQNYLTDVSVKCLMSSCQLKQSLVELNLGKNKLSQRSLNLITDNMINRGQHYLAKLRKLCLRENLIKCQEGEFRYYSGVFSSAGAHLDVDSNLIEMLELQHQYNELEIAVSLMAEIYVAKQLDCDASQYKNYCQIYTMVFLSQFYQCVDQIKRELANYGLFTTKYLGEDMYSFMDNKMPTVVGFHMLCADMQMVRDGFQSVVNNSQLSAVDLTECATAPPDSSIQYVNIRQVSLAIWCAPSWVNCFPRACWLTVLVREPPSQQDVDSLITMLNTKMPLLKVLELQSVQQHNDLSGCFNVKGVLAVIERICSGIQVIQLSRKIILDRNGAFTGYKCLQDVPRQILYGKLEMAPFTFNVPDDSIFMCQQCKSAQAQSTPHRQVQQPDTNLTNTIGSEGIFDVCRTSNMLCNSEQNVAAGSSPRHASNPTSLTSMPGADPASCKGVWGEETAAAAAAVMSCGSADQYNPHGATIQSIPNDEFKDQQAAAAVRGRSSTPSGVYNGKGATSALQQSQHPTVRQISIEDLDIGETSARESAVPVLQLTTAPQNSNQCSVPAVAPQDVLGCGTQTPEAVTQGWPQPRSLTGQIDINAILAFDIAAFKQSRAPMQAVRMSRGRLESSRILKSPLKYRIRQIGQ